MEGLDRIVAAHNRVVGEAGGAQETAQNFSSCECCCECCCEKCCESLGATSSSSRKKGATKMRNEEPTRSSDPPPGFTGDLAADVGTSLGGMRAHPERRFEDSVEDRSRAQREQELAAASEGELTTGARALSSQASQGHVELCRLSGRPC